MNVARFTVAYWCVFMAAMLPFMCTAIAKWGSFNKPRKEGGYDNHDPRAWLARQTDWRARANAAQANSFEALPLFIAGVLVAQQMGAPQGRVDALALAFVAARLAFIALYLADKASLRSLAWTVGVGCSVALFFSAS